MQQSPGSRMEEPDISQFMTLFNLLQAGGTLPPRKLSATPGPEEDSDSLDLLLRDAQAEELAQQQEDRYDPVSVSLDTEGEDLAVLGSPFAAGDNSDDDSRPTASRSMVPSAEDQDEQHAEDGSTGEHDRLQNVAAVFLLPGSGLRVHVSPDYDSADFLMSRLIRPGTVLEAQHVFDFEAPPPPSVGAAEDNQA